MSDPALREQLVTLLAAAGGSQIDPPTLLPARLMIELSGEAVRARLCAFTDASGQEWCLRPDMTTPIADLVARGLEAAGRRYYGGRVYRLPAASTDASIEFDQVGFEWFGGAGPEEDADALALTLETVARGGLREASVRIGDVGLFDAVLQALPFSDRWRLRLNRAFGRRGGVERLLSDASQPTQDAGDALAAGLAGLPDAVAARVIEDVFAIAGVRPLGGRTAEEIAERLRERQNDAPPEPHAASALLDYLAIDCPAQAAPDQLSKFARRAGVSASSLPLAAFEARCKRLDEQKPPHWAGARFHAGSGRRFEYYDGVVFEIATRDASEQPIAAGGRYDGLIPRLSQGKLNTSAIGASIRLDRLVLARSAA